MFKVIPAVDLKGGKVVRLRQGREDEITFQIDNPLEVAKKWVRKGAKALHIIDLDGAFKGKLVHEDVIFKIVEECKVEIEVGGGIRDFEVAERLIDGGVDRIIIGTLAVKKIDDVRGFAKKHPGSVMIAIDSKKDFVAIEGWKKDTKFKPYELAKLYEDLDVSILYTNIDVEGLVSGVVLDKVEEVISKVSLPVYVAGGISSKEDVKNIKKLGAAGVIIGSALYTGKLKFEELIK
ncbi:1-(5-phosphoribosyl)-5-((5-phosphoribosylamino)methylideneamino)imidazole-4-carboxamide isomerase [Archaeoglobales archaeon]|nr:MAG: 1-(5-phosphoribosyl)-5-((5-phosphoribosylamino)methylideneamino)imidazole-4-carboxamide isomerase [Archaeoglobales archaeon]